jgi:hypothetical protein
MQNVCRVPRSQQHHVLPATCSTQCSGWKLIAAGCVGKQQDREYCLGRGERPRPSTDRRQRSTWDSQKDLKERVNREKKLSDVYVKFYVELKEKFKGKRRRRAAAVES